MMKKLLFLLMMVLAAGTAFGQDAVTMAEDEKEIASADSLGTASEKFYVKPDDMPSFRGGIDGLIRYLRKKVKYPKDAQKRKVEGRVVVSFVVAQNGSIEDVKVVESVYPSLDKEAVRVVKRMPKWIPGKVDGEHVRVQYSLPISFRL